MKARFITSRLMSSFVAFLFAFQQVLWGAPGFGGLSFAPKPTPVIQQEQLLGFRPVGYMTGIEITDDGWMEFAWEGASSGQRIPISYREKMANLGFFFSALSLPEEELWVNLNVTSREGDILGKGLNFLDMGKVMLAADVELKRDVRRVFVETGIVDDVLEIAERFPSMGQDWRFAPRFWIVPGEVEIEENDRVMHIRSCSLDVKVALQEPHDKVEEQFNRFVAERIEKKVIPRLREIVNTDRRYMLLRQVLYAVVVAKWYKEHAREANGRFSEYIDSGAIEGLKARPWSRRQFLNEYLRLYKLGTIDSPLDDLEVVGGGIMLSSIGNKIRSIGLREGQRLRDVIRGEVDVIGMMDRQTDKTIESLPSVNEHTNLNKGANETKFLMGKIVMMDGTVYEIYTNVKIVNVERIDTDVGEIDILYGENAKFSDVFGALSPLRYDRRVLILVDNIERYVDEEILPALNENKIPERLLKVANYKSNKKAYFELLEAVYFPLVRCEFVNKDRQAIIKKIIESTVWHELDHKIRQLCCEDPYTEDLANLRPIFEKKAPFYRLMCMFTEDNLGPDVLQEFADQLEVFLPDFRPESVNDWLKKSGLINLSQDQLAKIALKVYLLVRKKRLERSRNDFYTYLVGLRSGEYGFSLELEGYLASRQLGLHIAPAYDQLRERVKRSLGKKEEVFISDILKIGEEILKEMNKKIAEFEKLLQQGRAPDVSVDSKKSARIDSASAGKEHIVFAFKDDNSMWNALTNTNIDLTMEVSSLPEAEEVIASVSEEYQGLGRSLYDQAYGMDVQILSFKRNGANLFAFSSRVEGMEFVGFAEEFADAKAGTPEHEAYRALVMHEAVERVQQLGGRIELAGEAELEITMPDGTREKIILSDPSAKVLARKAKKAIEAGDEGKARHYFARALVREMMPKADRVLSASIANAVGEGLRERLFNLLYDEGFEEGIFAPIVDGGGLVLDEYTESLLSELEQKVRTGDVEEVIGFVREKITEQVDMADELRKEIAVILARGELSIKEKTFLVIDSLIRNNVMPDASIDSDVDGLKGNLEALYRGAVYLFKVIAVEKDEDIERMVAPDVRVDRIAKVLSARPAVSREIAPLKGKEVGGINLSSFMLAPVARW